MWHIKSKEEGNIVGGGDLVGWVNCDLVADCDGGAVFAEESRLELKRGGCSAAQSFTTAAMVEVNRADVNLRKKKNFNNLKLNSM